MRYDPRRGCYVAEPSDEFDGNEVDGDASGPVQFQSQLGSVGTPWLRNNAMPPWHMWGNAQRFELTLLAGLQTSEVARGQMLKIEYGRPETWHWLFTCKFIEGDAAGVGEQLQLTVIWELTVGIGRTVQVNPAFDNFNRTWTNAAMPLPLIWTTETIQADPQRVGIAAPPFNFIREIVAQDIQLNARIALLATPPVATPRRVVVELGAQMAPKTHVRPDWFQPRQPHEVLFAGNETGHK